MLRHEIEFVNSRYRLSSLAIQTMIFDGTFSASLTIFSHTCFKMPLAFFKDFGVRYIFLKFWTMVLILKIMFSFVFCKKGEFCTVLAIGELCKSMLYYWLQNLCLKKLYFPCLFTPLFSTWFLNSAMIF